MSIFRTLRFAFFVASIASTASLSHCDSAKRVVSEITRIVSAPVTRDASEAEADHPPYADVAATVVQRARSLFPASTEGGQETVAGKGGRDAANSHATEAPRDD